VNLGLSKNSYFCLIGQNNVFRHTTSSQDVTGTFNNLRASAYNGRDTPEKILLLDKNPEKLPISFEICPRVDPLSR
jgi:hypothetical protein